MKKKRIYLSGPISGKDLEERRFAFSKKKHELENAGFEVISPLENGLSVESDTHAHMKRDFELLLTCDAIYMMEKWLHSAGCKVEFDVATAIGLEVFFEEVAVVGHGVVKFK